MNRYFAGISAAVLTMGYSAMAMAQSTAPTPLGQPPTRLPGDELGLMALAAAGIIAGIAIARRKQ